MSLTTHNAILIYEQAWMEEYRNPDKERPLLTLICNEGHVGPWSQWRQHKYRSMRTSIDYTQGSEYIINLAKRHVERRRGAPFHVWMKLVVMPKSENDLRVYFYFEQRD